LRHAFSPTANIEFQMDNTRKTAQCDFETVSAADVLDGLRTLTGRFGQGTVIPPPGYGPDTSLTWAIQDVSSALNLSDTQEQQKLCTSAIVNSRRALACLVDWYLERDLATHCKNPPKTAEQKAEFLVRRGIIDGLTSRVLARAVDKRNEVEHQYVAPTIEIAEDVVELFRQTMAVMRNQSDPSLAPWVFGVFLGGHGRLNGRLYAEFRGWCEPLTIFSRFRPRPWVGLLLPDGEVRALVRRAFLDTVSVDELIDLLALADQRYGHASSFQDMASCERMAQEIRLVEGGPAETVNQDRSMIYVGTASRERPA
jgi:hypothetical protein